MDDRMARINAQKEERDRVQREAMAADRKQEEEERQEMEEQALHMMDNTREIQLGKNLGEAKDASKATAKDPKAAKAKTKEKEKKLLAVKGKGDLDEKEPGAQRIPDADASGAMIPAGPGDDTVAGENEWVGQDNTQQQTSKKDKKAKKDKKDKKLKKKDKKRAREEEGDEEQGDDVALEEALEEEDVLPIAKEPDAADAADERRKDKKEKKDKKKKEKKKDKKAKKRRKEDAGSDSGEGDISPQVAPRTDEDIAMEEDLFGPDDE